MRLTFIPFNPLHENKDRVRQLLLKSTAKRHASEYARIGERLFTANVCKGSMILKLAERAYGVNIGEQIFITMTPAQINKVVNRCRESYMGDFYLLSLV